MKILHITATLEDGGAEAVLYRLCSNDRESEHTVVSLLGPGKYGPLLEKEGITVKSFDFRSAKGLITGFFGLVNFLIRSKPDVIQTWLYYGNIIGGMASTLAGFRRVVWSIHHSNFSRGTIKPITRMMVYAGALSSRFIPRKIIFCSANATTAHEDVGYAGKKFVVIPNGYNITEFSEVPGARTAISKAHLINDNSFLIGMVARYDAQKDHANFLRALAIFKKENPATRIQAILVGPGIDSNNKELIELIKNSNVENIVTLLGSRSDIPTLMSAFDIHVLSSLGEAFPNVLAEAMACGTPCITTDVGDAGYIVSDTGWVVPPQDSSALAVAMTSALLARNSQNEWLQRKIHSRNRIIELFSIENMTNNYSSVWRSVCMHT